MDNIVFNKCQTPLDELHLEKYSKEVQEQFFDFLNNVPFIRWLVSKDRPYISELPRDEYGRAIIDVTKPPILEGSDYFRQTAKKWQDTGQYTSLKPNVNPNSDFGRWLLEEKRRGWEGLVNPDTGMWVTGDYYWMLNYCPMHMIKKSPSGLTQRVVMHPNFWDGQFFTTHYFYQARLHGHHAAELASRGKGKTSLGAAMLSKRFVIGEFGDNQQEIQCFVTAADRTKMMNPNQILSVFVDNIDFCAKNTQFDSRRLKSSNQEMAWKMGYNKSGSNIEYGSKNTVTGVITGVNQDKLNGSRGVLYLIEEAGIFKDLRALYNMIRPSVEQGSDIFGEIISYGCVCAGTKVWANDGRYLNIEELKKEDGIIGYENDLPVKNTIGTLLEPRKKPCVRIEWEHGNYLECSVDHPILKQIIHTPRINGREQRKRTPEEVWVRAGNLKVGDKILEGRYIGAFGEDTLEDPRLVGMLIGDGSYGFDNTPKFSSEDTELLDYIKSKYEWGVSAERRTKSGKLYQDIRVKGICPLLRRVGIYGQTKNKKRLPIKYQTLTKEDTALLLAGLYDTDGCISKIGKHFSIQLTQANKEILQQVSLLLRKFGIYSCIGTNRPSIKEGRKDKNPWYILSVSGRVNIELFYENIPLIQSDKKNKLYALYRWFVEHPLQKCRCYDDKKVYQRTIHSIEYIGVRTIYNLSAEQSHTYLANNIITHNTAGDSQSDFVDFAEMIYSPEGFNLEPLDNVYDKEGQGRRTITIFYPAYLNYDTSCIDVDGNSDVTKALLMICNDRYKVKYGTSDINTITKRISQYPITPQEAIIRSQGNVFPVTELNERLNQIDNNPNEFDDVYVGELVQVNSPVQTEGKYVHNGVEFKPTGDLPIRDFPTSDNKVLGALEIYTMPQSGSNGEVPFGRYIISADPFDSDVAKTMSLGSCLVLDTWTDTLVAEYTGRPMFAEDFYEKVRLLCLFYNTQCMYESNIKGMFSYFSSHSSTHLLADTPEYLKERQMVSSIGYGNASKGIRATTPVINGAFKMINSWLRKSVTKVEKGADGNEHEVTVPNLFHIRNRALLKELIQWNPYGNYDRCVLGDTQVQTIDGIKEIKDITLEDSVLTVSGEYNPVCQLHKNPFSGTMYKFRALGDYRYLNCTYNHPIACRHREVLPKGKNYMRDRNKLSAPEYKEAQYITKEDFVLIPKRINLPFCLLPDDKLYLLGWYIADGNASSGNNVMFSLQGDQYEIAKEIKRILDKYWARDYTFIEESTRQCKDKIIVQPAHNKQGHVEARIFKSYTKYKGNHVNCWNVCMASKDAQEFFVTYGGGPNNKDIAESLYRTKGLLPLIRGLFEGDGHYRCEVRCDGSMRNSLELSSVYDKLIHKVRQILIDEGIWCTVRKISRRGLMSREQYNLNIVNNHVIPIIEGSLKFKQLIPKHVRTTKENYFEDSWGFWVKLRDLSSYEYSGDVYNIGVENDHSYCANGIATHNCMSLVQLMLYREEKMILFHGDMRKMEAPSSGMENDNYWDKNYPKHREMKAEEYMKKFMGRHLYKGQ
jgi:intein/homing endonuclease